MHIAEKAVAPSHSRSTGSGALRRQPVLARHDLARGEGAARQDPREPFAASRSQEETVPPILHEVLGSRGLPLNAAERTFFEPRFGHNFAHVRVHADASAGASARMLRANAYTVGPHIVFAENRYAPDTASGRRLLAHELVHVVQQSEPSGDVSGLAGVSRSGEATETEADRISGRITENSSLPARNAAPVDVRERASAAVVHRDTRPWPFNGYVINNSDKAVTVWSDGDGLYTIGAGKTSERFSEDVDHIMNRSKQWYKIGANTVTVAKDGTISGYKCAVSNYGQDCPQGAQNSPFTRLSFRGLYLERPIESGNPAP